MAAGLAGWAITVLAAQAAAGRLTAAITGSPFLPYLAFAACCGAVTWYATRIPRGSLMNIELSDLTRRFGRT